AGAATDFRPQPPAILWSEESQRGSSRGLATAVGSDTVIDTGRVAEDRTERRQSGECASYDQLVADRTTRRANGDLTGQALRPTIECVATSAECGASILVTPASPAATTHPHPTACAPESIPTPLAETRSDPQAIPPPALEGASAPSSEQTPR